MIRTYNLVFMCEFWFVYLNSTQWGNVFLTQLWTLRNSMISMRTKFQDNQPVISKTYNKVRGLLGPLLFIPSAFRKNNYNKTKQLSKSLSYFSNSNHFNINQHSQRHAPSNRLDWILFSIRVRSSYIWRQSSSVRLSSRFVKISPPKFGKNFLTEFIRLSIVKLF